MHDAGRCDQSQNCSAYLHHHTELSPLKVLYQIADGERFLSFLCLSCTICPLQSDALPGGARKIPALSQNRASHVIEGVPDTFPSSVKRLLCPRQRRGLQRCCSSARSSGWSLRARLRRRGTGVDNREIRVPSRGLVLPFVVHCTQSRTVF
jgi:hypothetical protein